MHSEYTSRDVAKRRLSQVLVNDRASVSPELMELLKQEVPTLVIRFPVLGVSRERAVVEHGLD